MRNRVKGIVINKIIIIGCITNNNNNIKLDLNRNRTNKIMGNPNNRINSLIKIINHKRYIPMGVLVGSVEEDLAEILVCTNMLQDSHGI